MMRGLKSFGLLILVGTVWCAAGSQRRSTEVTILVSPTDVVRVSPTAGLELSSSALDPPIRKALESTSERDFRLLLLSSALVAIGIFFEFPDVLSELGEWRRSYPRKTWTPVWSLIGFLLVVLGVTSEGIFEGYVGADETKIRKFDNNVISDTESKARDLENSTQQLKTDEANARAEAAKDWRVRIWKRKFSREPLAKMTARKSPINCAALLRLSMVARSK